MADKNVGHKCPTCETMPKHQPNAFPCKDVGWGLPHRQ